MRQSDEYLSEKWTPAVEKLALEDLLEDFFTRGVCLRHTHSNNKMRMVFAETWVSKTPS